MKNKLFNRYYIFAVFGVLLASFYPLYMGVKIIPDMIADGIVWKENYPKYIIPYTPICVAILVGVLIWPLCIKLFRRFALVGGSAAAIGIFFTVETLLERNVVVATAEISAKLEDWQMFMCYSYRPGDVTTTYTTETPVDILMGNYNPAFKLHFYVISVVLIISVLNCLYGFANIVKTGEKKRLRALILQSVSSLMFLGLCILACFTAFWRDGNIQVSPISAVLMAAFFILLGVTVGIYTGSFLLSKRKFVSVVIPAIVSALMTTLMYIGEMILLGGNLYILGTGFIFSSIPVIVLAPVDLMIITASGGVTALIFILLNKKKIQ